MSKYENVLVKARYECDGLFLVLQTYQRNVGKSPEIWLAVRNIGRLAEIEDNYPLDVRTSYGDYVRLVKQGDMIRLEITWFTLCGDRISQGYRQNVYIRAEQLAPGKYLAHTELRENRIVYTESAHRLIASLNKEERRAFSKWARNYNCYHTGQNTITVFRDWGKDFGFREEGTWSTRGGINLSCGRRGLKYSMNT